MNGLYMITQKSSTDIMSQALASLVANGKLAESEVDRVLLLAERTRQGSYITLDRMGLVSQDDWAQALAQVAGLTVLELADMPTELAKHPLLSSDYLRRMRIAPLHICDNIAKFAMSDPGDVASVSALQMVFGERLELFVASERCIDSAYERHDATIIEPESNAGAPDQAEADTNYLLEIANKAPTIKFVDTLLDRAIVVGASDIHLEPQEGYVRARLRIDGILSETDGPHKSLYSGVISRLKIMANLDIAERRLPQDGHFRHRSHGQTFGIRISTTALIHGEAITLRILSMGEELRSLAALNMPLSIRTRFEEALAQPNGLILVTGPTGSGKTTTLHAALNELNVVGRKIVTIENPVEIRTPGVIQIETDPAIGWSFSAALRTVLRHDPDVLMVGEIRDAETAELAIQAALTGHLVLSTLHTKSASETVARLVSMGVPDYLLRGVLILAAAQRLVRVLCENCAQPSPRDLAEEYWKVLNPSLPRRSELSQRSRWTFRRSVGCYKCNNHGYVGRAAVFDVLGNQRVSETTTDPSSTSDGELTVNALRLVADGVTTLEEVSRVTGQFHECLNNNQRELQL